MRTLHVAHADIITALGPVYVAAHPYPEGAREHIETVGKKSGNVKGEFVQLQPGFYNDDDEPRFQKGVKGVTWNPAMTGEIMEALEDTMTEEEFEAWEAEQDDEED